MMKFAKEGDGMSDALPVIKDTIDQYMHKQEFG